jgi:hypothetical protein
MRTFIQLRDGIGFAHIFTEGEPDHSVTPDHTTAIEVTGTDNPDQFLNKKYDEETKTWSPAPIIYFAEVNQNGQIIEIGKTYFSHAIPAGRVIMPEGINSYWRYIDGDWVAPGIYVPSEPVEEEPQVMLESAHVESEQN